MFYEKKEKNSKNDALQSLLIVLLNFPVLISQLKLVHYENYRNNKKLQPLH